MQRQTLPAESAASALLSEQTPQSLRGPRGADRDAAELPNPPLLTRTAGSAG